jgi:hypothetical protein
MKYDIIGDVHGQAELLESLLKKLGYQSDLTGAWFHSQRKALFVGDLINRGPEIKRTVKIVRQMVDGGYAEAVVGNHELAWIEGMEVRFSATIISYQNDLEQLKSDFKWIRSLPFFIEKKGIRIVHAYWDYHAINHIIHWEALEENKRSDFQEAYRKSIWLLTNGPYYQVSAEEGITQNQIQKSRMKLRWWNIDVPLYGIKEKPLFFGHYCLVDGPEIAQGNICCLDACSYKPNVLAAYRWAGETELKAENLIVVN